MPHRFYTQFDVRRFWMRRRLTWRVSLALAVSVVFLAVGVMALQLWLARTAALEDRKRDIANLLQVLEQHIAVTLRGADHTLANLASALGRLSPEAVASESTNALLAREVTQTPYARVIFVTDSDGVSVNDSSPFPPQRVTVSDRPYFAVHRDNVRAGLHISPVFSRVSGQWFIGMSRRLESPDGRFAGVVGVGLEPSFLTDLYSSLDLGANGVITLVHDDTRLLVRAPWVEDMIGRRLQAATQFIERARKGSRFVEVLTSPVDGTVRLAGNARLKDYPVTVVVGVVQAEALASWWSHAYVIGGGIAVVLTLSLSLILLLARAMRRQEKSFESLRLRDRALEATSTGVVITDATLPDNPVVYTNPAFERITGYTATEMTGRNCRILNGPHRDQEALERLRQAIAGAQPCVVTLENSRKDGTTFWNELRVSPVRNSRGELANFIGAVTDVTEQLQVETQLRASQKMEAIGQLTGGIAHDFNNLLAVVVGNLEIVTDELPAGSSVLAYVGTAMRAAVRGGDLTKHLLAFGRRQNLTPRPCDIRGVVNDAVKMLEHTVAENILISVVPDAAPTVALLDANQLENAIVNLALNARDAMPEGGRVRISTRVVETAALRVLPGEGPDVVPDGRYAVISVEDEGSGIPPGIVHKVFEPFFTTKSLGQGTGLGLSMVYGFVRQSGGFVRLHTAENTGTTVTMLFPAVDAPGSLVAAEPVPIPVSSDPAGQGRRILLVEDVADMRQTITQMLERIGFEVVAAADAHEALVHLSQERVNGMLTDIGLPGRLNGAELVSIVAERFPHVRTATMTGYASHAQLDDNRSEASRPHLVKPFRSAELAAAMRSLFGQPA